MAKRTKTIRRQIANELFECVWLFCEIGAKRAKKWKKLHTLEFGSFAVFLTIASGSWESNNLNSVSYDEASLRMK